MTMTTRKNATTKALQSKLATDKKHDTQALLEWLIACNTNNKRGHVYDQHELLSLYAQGNRWDGEGVDAHGATKNVHLYDHNGNEFKYIVVKRHMKNGYIDEHAHDPNTKQTGNQLVDEIDCWVEYAETEHADLLCPILKYFKSKSDKVEATSEKMQYNVLIIAQKAVAVGDANYACRKAERLNDRNGYNGESASERYEKLAKLSKKQGWRDAMHNGGNSGVIFDYSKNCYKAVFIDYAL